MKHYILLDQLHSWYYADIDKYKVINRGEKFMQFCGKCNGALTGLEWLPPYIVRLSNRRLADILFGVSYFIVSEKFKLAYESSGLLGLSNFREVEVNYRGKPIAEKYYYPEVLVESYLIDLSTIVYEKDFKHEVTYPYDLCELCQRSSEYFLKKVKGVRVLNPEKIDKDIFELSSIKELIISENFKEFVDKHRFTNFNIVELSKYRYDSHYYIKYKNGEMFYDPERINYNELSAEELVGWLPEKQGFDVVRIKDLLSEAGYKPWHRQYDAEVIRWLRRTKNVTEVRFHEYLSEINNLYLMKKFSKSDVNLLMNNNK